MRTPKRLFLTATLPVVAALLSACTGSSPTATTSATAETTNASETTNPPETTTPSATSVVLDATTTSAGLPITSVTTATVAESGWRPEAIGVFTQFSGGIDHIAFAPDGSAAAFTNVETSCCSTATFGWIRTAGGKWGSINNTQQTFVTGDGPGAYGGVSDIVWFNNQFVAVGTRGGNSATEGDPIPPIPTIWTSPDGIAWTATEQPSGKVTGGLEVSSDGTTLLGTGATETALMVYSTTDGTTWKELGTIPSPDSGRQPFSTDLLIHSAPDTTPTYVVVGSFNKVNSSGASPFVSTSSDGATWTTQELAAPVGKGGSSADIAVFFNNQVIVYGTGYSELADGTPVNTAIGWTSSDKGKTFTALKLTSNCDGAFSSVVVDQAAPESTMFAVCTALVGPQEGDFISSTDKLVITRDGSTFETPTNMAPEWSTPSEEISVGPVSLDNGRVVLPVGKPNGEEGRQVSLWRA
jgi:hypothetical protein